MVGPSPRRDPARRPSVNESHAQPEEPAPYGARSSLIDPAEPTAPTGPTGPRKIRIHHLSQFKARGEKWAMLTAYDQLSAQIFDQAGIPVLLVGDSAANNVLG